MTMAEPLRYYLVTLHFRSSCPQTQVDMSRVLREAPQWWNHITDVWIVGTRGTADELYQRLKPHLDGYTRLLICEIQPNASMQGWLPAEGWDWLRERNVGSLGKA